MNKKITKLPYALTLIYFILSLQFQMSFSQEIPIWEKINKFSNSSDKGGKANTLLFNLKASDLEKKLESITRDKTGILFFPSGNNEKFVPYQVKETEVMHSELAKKFPSIKSYKGVSKDKSNKTIRFTYNPDTGFYGFLESNSKIEIRPFNNKGLYEFIVNSHEINSIPFKCNTEEEAQNIKNTTGIVKRDVDDGNLRRYRLALSVSGEYSQFFLDGTEEDDAERITKVLAAMVNSVNRLNQVFERDLGVTLQLISNNDQLIFLDPNTDPYTGGFNMALQDFLTTTIGESNYDVGHLFLKENTVFGSAGCIACVCTDGSKGSAFTAHTDPSSDNMNIIAAHEFGHQFGAYHTQSSTNCRSAIGTSEVEPGSGSTIMSYAGICFPNVQSEADNYFNYTSIRDIAVWTINNSSCAELISIENSSPSINAGLDYVIPKSTAFVLEGFAEDIDSGDTLSYCWEQNDSDDPNSSQSPSPSRFVGPMFRSFPPTSSNKRYFPNLNDVISNNLTPTWEMLPSVSRDLNFVMTVRDNGISGGQIVSDAVRISVNDNTGPFTVTSQSNSSDSWTVGDLVTVTWNVANTDLTPINAVNVEILLSTDGGVTFSETLITTANDGEETFSLPDVDGTSEARIMIKAVDNVFFAVNQENFKIQKSEYVLISEKVSIDICDTENAVFNLEYKTFLDFDEAVSLSTSNLPVGINATLSEDTFGGANTAGVPFVLTLAGIDSLIPGIYTFNLAGVSTSNIEKNIELSFSVFTENDMGIGLIAPSNNSDSQELDVEFNWEKDNNSTSYQIEIATDNAFSNIIDVFSTTNTTYISSNLENDKEYFWRIQLVNPCGNSPLSNVNTFSTKCSVPTNFNTINAESDTIEIAWEDTDSITSWDIEYGLTGFVLGTGTISTTNSKQYIAESLNSGTSYDFYVKGNCNSGGNSTRIGPFAITTKFNYCNGDRFFDSGGKFGDYSNSENTTTVIAPEINNDRVRVIFNDFSLEACCDFLTVYDGPDNSAPIIGSYTTLPLDQIVSTHASGALTFVFTSDGSVTDSGWDATVICEPKPNCLAPRNLNFANLESKQVDLSWTQEGSELDWTIEYGSQGFIPGTGVGVELNSTTLNKTITNLIPNTAYSAYVKTNCIIGGFSDWSGVISFETEEACEMPTNFQALSTTKNTAELRWDNDSNATEWEVEYNTDFFTPGTGIGTQETALTNSIKLENLLPNTEYYAFLRNNCGIDDGYSNWAGSVFFRTEEACVLPTSFQALSIGTTSTELRWNNDNNATEWEVEYSKDSFTPGTGNGIQEKTLTNSINLENLLPDTQYNAYVRSNCGIDDGYSNWAGSVFFRTKATCEIPTGFQALSITTTTTELVWSNDNNATEWEVEYSTNFFTPGTGTGIQETTLTNSINLESLLPGTEYYAYVRSNCGIEDGYSNWAGSVFFRTEVACEIPSSFQALSVTTTTAELRWNNDSNATEWEVEYGTDFFTPGTGTGIQETTLTNSINLESLLPDRDYYAYVRSNCGIEDGYSNWAGFVFFRTELACAVPTNFNVSVATENTVELVWDDDSNAIEWEIEYDITPFSPGNGTREMTSTNSIVIENLNSNTTYYAYLRKNCGVDGFSNWTNQILFRTTANYCNGDRFFDTGGEFENYSDNENTTTVIAPESNSDRVKVVFNNFSLETCCDLLSVYDGPDNSAPFIGAYNTLPLDEIVSTHDSGALTFIFTSDGSGTSSGWDATVICEPKPNCLAPINFTAVRQGETEVEFSWEQNDAENEWTLEYGLSGFLVGNGTTVTSNTTSKLISGLNASTSYDIYIKTNCTAGGFSSLVGPLNFNTLCSIDPNETNLIVNGSFECGSAAGWNISGPNDPSNPCNLNFTVLDSSVTVCFSDNEITPTNGTYAAFTSFDGNENTTYVLEQTIIIPEDINDAFEAVMSFDFKVNFNTFSASVERVLSVRFTNLSGVELFKAEEIGFGLSPVNGSIDITFSEDILSNLIAYAGETIKLSFEAFVPETFTGPSKALVDNVSLIINRSLSNNDTMLNKNELSIYPIPNNGTFTINNNNAGEIDTVEIFDISGRLILRDSLKIPSNKVNVALENVDSGVYFVHVYVKGTTLTKRIIIE